MTVVQKVWSTVEDCVSPPQYCALEECERGYRIEYLHNIGVNLYVIRRVSCSIRLAEVSSSGSKVLC